MKVPQVMVTKLIISRMATQNRVQLIEVQK